MTSIASDSTPTTTAVGQAYEHSRRLLVGVVAMTDDEVDPGLRQRLLRRALAATMRCLDARRAQDPDAHLLLEEALRAARAITDMAAAHAELGGEGRDAAIAIDSLASDSIGQIEAALATVG